jgi:tetratricopeptide (TPR) repeat protein
MIEKKEAQKLLSSLNEMINEYWFDMIIKRWQKLGYIKDNEQQDSKLKECLECNNCKGANDYYKSVCFFCGGTGKIKKEQVENINVDDMYIAEKKVDKLEEARKYNYTMFDIHYLRNEDLEKLLYDIQDQTFICLGEHLEQIKLFQQAIEQIIKALKYCQDDKEVMQNEIDILKQQKPPRKCIEWLKKIRDKVNFFDSIQATKLLEFLEKIK